MDSNLEKWTKELDDLDVQISLGEEEYVEAFEEQKSRFLGWINEANASIQGQAEKYGVDEKLNAVKAKFEELQLQLALGKAESKEAFEEQRKKIENTLQNCNQAFDEYKSQAGEKAGDLGEGFQQQLENFRTKLDVYRLHFALGSADAQDELAEKKKELKSRVLEMREKAEKKGEETVGEMEEKWDGVKEELSEAYDHFKGALKRLFD